MIKLTPNQLERLSNALGQGFPTESELAQLLTFNVGGRNLQWIAGGNGLKEIIFALISKAQSEHWLHELIQGAVTRNPTADLQQLANEMRPAMISAAADHFNVTFIANNRAMVNRTILRNSLKQLAGSTLTGAQILVVNGPAQSGKTYSVELISYLFRALRSFNFVSVDLKKPTSEVTPLYIAEEIVEQMLLDRSIIPKLDDEQDSRWVRRFCNGLQGVLSATKETKWIVIDGFNHARLSPSVKDMVDELSERIRLNLPEVRLVLLSYPNNLSPSVESVAIRETITRIDQRDLTNFFNQIYLEANKQFSPRDIAERIGEVLRNANPDSPNYMEMLGMEVVRVANEIRA